MKLNIKITDGKCSEAFYIVIFTSIESFFQPCNMYRDCPRGVPREGQNVQKCAKMVTWSTSRCTINGFQKSRQDVRSTSHGEEFQKSSSYRETIALLYPGIVLVRAYYYASNHFIGYWIRGLLWKPLSRSSLAVGSWADPIPTIVLTFRCLHGSAPSYLANSLRRTVDVAVVIGADFAGATAPAVKILRGRRPSGH